MKFTFNTISRLASVKGIAALSLALTALVLPACGVGEEEGVYEEGVGEEEVYEEEEGVLEEEEGVLEEEEGFGEEVE
jgi:hypothetical protein